MREILLEFGLNFPESILFLALFMIKFNIKLKENKLKVGISLLLLTFSNYYLPTLVNTFYMHLFVLFTSFTFIMSVMFNQSMFKTFLSVFKTFIFMVIIEGLCMFVINNTFGTNMMIESNLDRLIHTIPFRIIEFVGLAIYYKTNKRR